MVSLEAGQPLAGYRYDGKHVQIVWANPFTTGGETRRVSVRYTVHNPVAGAYVRFWVGVWYALGAVVCIVSSGAPCVCRGAV